jgi:hypothetical protein
MATFTERGEEVTLEHLFKSTGTQLCLAVGAELTEISDPAYSRANLPAVLGSVANGAIMNTSPIDFNSGEEVASYWYVVNASNQVLVFGPLPSPQFGEFTLPVGAFRLQAIAG